MSGSLRYECADGIGTITIDRPEKKGAMGFAMLAEFIELVARAGADDACRVLILTGTPGCFCAGTDLVDLATIPGSERGLRGEASEGGRWWPLVACPKPVIGAIDGPAVGMGAEFASQCDIRVASKRARFAWNFAHRGLVPDTGAGTWLLPRLVGTGTALRWLYSGKFVSAEQAYESGFVDVLVEPEELEATVQAEAESFLTSSPLSLRRMKELLYEGLSSGVGEHMARHVVALKDCFRSDDHREGVVSFLERRPASFTGR